VCVSDAKFQIEASGGHQGRVKLSDSVELYSSHCEVRATDLGSGEV